MVHRRELKEKAMRLIPLAAAAPLAVAAAQTPVNGITSSEVYNSCWTNRPSERERKLAWLDAVCKSRRPQAQQDCAEAWAKIRAAQARRAAASAAAGEQ